MIQVPTHPLYQIPLEVAMSANRRKGFMDSGMYPGGKRDRV